MAKDFRLMRRRTYLLDAGTLSTHQSASGCRCRLAVMYLSPYQALPLLRQREIHPQAYQLR